MSNKLTSLQILLFTIGFTVNAQVNQLVLPVGWSMFGSTCVDSIDVIEGFIDISDDIVIIKDEYGMSYLPSWNFNAIGSLQYSEGYQIKMINEVLGFQLCSPVIPEDGIGQAEIDSAYLEGVSSVTPEDGITQSDVDRAIAAITPEDGIGQAEVDSAYLVGASSIIPEDGITQLDVDAAIASITPEDGIGQADVDSAYALGVSSIIIEHEICQLNLDAALAAITPEDGIGQAEVDSAYIDGAASIIPEDGITQSDVDSAVSAITPEDGIGQTEVDAAYASGVSSVIPDDGISQLDVTAAIDSVNALWTSISTPFSSAQGVTDMAAIYQYLSVYEGGIPHALVFGGGEVLYPGVYDVTGAASISVGTLTLDGGGDPNSVFIIRSTGAFTTGVGSTIVLINGANARNIFWMSEVALSTAANTIMKGTLVSPAGAIGLGAGTQLEGRILTKLGALTSVTGCVITVPLGTSPIDLGQLSTFAMWTSGGAVSDAATSTTIGDVGTASGALTISGSLTGFEYPAGTL